MNKLVIIAMLIVSILQCEASEKIDECIYKFTYHTMIRTTKENTQPDIENYILEVGKKSSKFYPPRFEASVVLKDSILRVGMNPDDVFNLLMSRNLFDVRQSMRIIKNYPKKGQTAEIGNMGEDYMTVENTPVQKWKIIPGDSVIAGYKCSCAKTSFRGRVWTAWFTSDIPIHLGPWKLGGLPGLILYAKDSAGLFVFDCKQIAKGKSSAINVVAKKGYRRCGLKDFHNLKKEWLSNSLGMMIQAAGLSGEQMPRKAKKRTPYTLELSIE